jgi:hypothetical protein
MAWQQDFENETFPTRLGQNFQPWSKLFLPHAKVLNYIHKQQKGVKALPWIFFRKPNIFYQALGYISGECLHKTFPGQNFI